MRSILVTTLIVVLSSIPALVFSQAPANDNCSGAITLTPGTSCTPTSGTIVNASYTTLSANCGSTNRDVWYRFIAQSTTHTITVSSSSNRRRFQLFSGTCSSLTSINCSSNESLTATGLTIGNTYYVRVYSSLSSTTFPFDICITQPAPSNITYSRSYINVSKGLTGGTVDPGDTLEMRATIVISGNGSSADSLAFFDTLFNGRGLRLVPGSIALRTNEGKVYKAFTDGFDSDAGWYSTSGTDTIIRINFGAGATNMARGRLNYNSRPSVFGTTCIIMATYRAVVYAGYNTRINFKTGALTFRDVATGILNKVTFKPNDLIVFQSPGLCPNAVSATNALGAEFNGTFGIPSGSAPLNRNRGTSPFTSYTYAPFTASGGPGDYYYGITNNTSQKFTTINTWNKPDANGYRVFSQWDITGDHTGASDKIKGNPACDTTQPVSPSNPCGYMLVINSAYKADTAFTYTVSNLCPNTYYEISAWFKNICYKCGCDSTGITGASPGYIPTAPGDSSGVRPNIAFDVNGVDYYTTGDILYTGTTPTGSDATNTWVKRGFTYLTGPTETSFTLTLRNNAPGGGGNDWALDDISVATCLPDMKYSPTLNPEACKSNPIEIRDTVRSYFNNYNHYKWQRSTDNGATWTDISGETGTATPAWNGTEWQYVLSYTIPPANTTMANGGDKYRVAVATTASNLLTSSCLFSDGISIVNLVVKDCSPTLGVQLLSFSGRVVNGFASLAWKTTATDEPAQFNIEKSLDGTNFAHIGIIPFSNHNAFYTFADPEVLPSKAWYRIKIISSKNGQKYSPNILLENKAEEYGLTAVNPFSRRLVFNIESKKDAHIDVMLLNATGNLIRKQTYAARKGVNSYQMHDVDALANGVYILQVRSNGNIISRKIIKQ